MLGHDLIHQLAPANELLLTDIRGARGNTVHYLDITDADACESLAGEFAPDCVVHSAAFTRVDDCERSSELAMTVNGSGAGNVARACSKSGAFMVYFSTDYLFNGQQREPYREDAEVDPLSVYGRSKLEGENQVRRFLPDRHLIIRTSWLFGLNGPNFVETMIRLAQTHDTLRVVDDQIGRPTYTPDLADATSRLLEAGTHGVVNVANSGETSWYGFARYILSIASPHTSVVSISTDEYPLPAGRPEFSVLSLTQFEAVTGHRMPVWQDAVDRYLASRQTVKWKELSK